MKLSKNFSREEFACRCASDCGYNTVDAELITVLQDLRDVFGPLKITSGHRCPDHNRAVGGKPRSMHLTGKAADVQPADTAKIPEMADYLESNYKNRFGIGRYSTFIHVDVRQSPGRWTG